MQLGLLERLAHSEGQEVNIVDVWRRLDDDRYTGRNWLVKLAIRVLSIVSNSAGCERFISQMGYTQTKHRSRLDVERVRNTVVLKNALMHEYQPDNTHTHGIKRKRRDFDWDTNQEAGNVSVTQPENVGESTGSDQIEFGANMLNYDEDPEVEYDVTLLLNNPEAYFTRLTQRLINDVIEEDATTAAEVQAIATSSHTPNLQAGGSVSLYGSYGGPIHTPLSQIFNFDESEATNPQVEGSSTSVGST
ncbi:hypothetical protein FRC11_008738 [Ceratobasidium sp. 423]|nr:hypothetical protein FRC11_008738 [Ceratobasidium sp. 423]